jgi:hypothetical protein
MLTYGSCFQLECHFQLVFVDCHGFQLQIKSQLSLLFSITNYSWKGVGNVVGKVGFSF